MNEQYRLYKHAWIYDEAPHTEQVLSDEQMRSLLHKGGWMVRNTYDFDTPNHTAFWYVIKDCFGGMEELSTKTRNQIRRGMAHYTVQQISKEEMLAKGYPIYCAATASYKTTATTPTLTEYQRRITEADNDIEYWGAYNHNNDLVAFSINKTGADYCNYQTLKSIPTDMKNYVYYALIYTMNRHYLQERRMGYVLDGARSVTEHSNIQPFLEEKFNFRKAYCHLRISYIWWFGIIVKCLYPFGRIIKIPQIRAVLSMHGMQNQE